MKNQKPKKITKSFTHVTYIKSSRDFRKKYELIRYKKNGLLACSCPAFRFNLGFQGEYKCKHIRQFLGEM